MMAKLKTVPELRFPGFPEPWKHRDIGSVAKAITSGSRDWAQYYAETGSKFIRMTNLPRGGIQLLLDDMKFVALPEDSSEGKRTSLEANDILISITAELGKIGWIPPGFGTAYINQHTALIRLDLDRADARFVAHVLSSERMNNEINSLNDSGAKAGLNLPTIRSFPLILPTLPEQRKIADFLTAVDGRIQQLSQKKALLEDYKKGVMQQLFTQALRFKDDHGHEFPDWEEKRLVELCSTFKSGKGITSEQIQEAGEYPVFGGNGLRGYTDTFTHDGVYLLIGRQGALCGNINRVSGKTYISEHAIAMAGNELANTEWLAQRLDHLNLNRLSESSAQPGLAVNKLERLKLSTPSLPEQTKIANFLTALDRKIESVAQQITHTQAFKRGLLQQMFV